MVSVDDIITARDAIAGRVVRTPLQYSEMLSDRLCSDVHLKLECLQHTGSFKARGAFNKILSLTEEERARGIITASGGNHGQAAAYVAREMGVDAIVVVHENSPKNKVDGIRKHGAKVIIHGKDYNDAYEHSLKLQKESGATYLHAFDDPYTVAGQGTVGLEIHEDLPDVDVVVCGIGGGGLIAGTSLALKSLKPDVRIIGIQSEGAASLPESLKAGRPVPLERVDTLADGLAARAVGDIPFGIIREHVDTVQTVSDGELLDGIFWLLEEDGIVVEPAGATGVSACLAGKVEKLEKKRVVCVVSGGNLAPDILQMALDRKQDGV